MTLNFREKTSLNLITNMLRTMAMVIIGIFMVPYYVDTLGIASYAIIPLATTMATYIQFVSDCIAYASIRYTTLAFNEGNTVEANKTISTSFYGLGKICLASIPFGIILAIYSPIIFDITGSTSFEVQMLFGMIILSSLVVTMSTPFNGVFYASNNLYLMYFAKFAYTISQIAVIILLFSIGETSLTSIGIGYAISSILIFILLYILAKRTEKEMQISKKLCDKTLFQKIGSLGFWSILSKISGMLYIQLSMILVNLYLGSEAQGGFAMVSTIISMVHTAIFALTDTIEPIIFKCYSEHKNEELISILYTSTKLLSLILAFPILFIIVFSDEFLGAWVGSEYNYLSTLLTIGLIGDFTYCVISVTNTVQRLYLKIKIPTLVSFILGAFNAIATIAILCEPANKVESAMTIWATAIIAVTVFDAIYNAHLTKAPKYKYGVTTVMGYGIMIILYYPLTALKDILSLPPMWIPLLITMMVLFLAYFIIGYLVLFTKNEKKLVNSILPERISKYMAKLTRA